MPDTFSIEPEEPTRPSFRGCNHVDMSGESLIEEKEGWRRCTSCGASWHEKETVDIS